MFHHDLLLGYFASLNLAEEAGQSTVETRQPASLPLLSETPNTLQEKSVKEPTAPLNPITAPSEGPILLPCGHESPNPQARFCSICGRPISGPPPKQ